ncbi:MAG: histidinol-phosphate transaminase [Bacteroidota bacterium]
MKFSSMKTIDIHALLRPHLRKLTPYSSARDEYTGKLGTFLDANENPLGSAAPGRHNRYPDPLARELKQSLRSILGVKEEQLFVGNGSDEAIDLLFRAFCEPGQDRVVLLPPTYGMYKVSAEINGVETVEYPLTEAFQIDLDKIRTDLLPKTKLIFVCSPNNPTGNCIHQASIEALLEWMAEDGLVVVDEAYVDFAPQQKLIPLLDKYPHLVLLRTFSKAWGMANLRLGMAIGHPDLIAALNKIKAPYNVNGMSQQLALEAIQQEDKKIEMVDLIVQERNNLARELNNISFVSRVYPSDANFLLVRVDHARQRYEELINKRIIVRDRSRVILCDECLRFTIGSPDENEELLQALQHMSK